MSAKGIPDAPGGPVTNALSVDVEDYFMVSAFADRIPFERWAEHEPRVAANTDRVLDILGRHRVKATFFVLGWVAERFPGIVRRIAQEGHEVGCHGYNHRLVYAMTAAEFRDDTRKAKDLIEAAGGTEVVGYRAPSYSITARSLWAIDQLIELGFRYDSSIFPVRHDRYGIPGFARSVTVVDGKDGGRSIVEVPLSTLRILGANLPFGGGGYLRLYPGFVTERAIRFLNEKEGRPAVVYVHPWELDPGQPRLTGSRVSVFRHYTNIRTTEPKLIRLLERFRFAPVRDVVFPAPAGAAAVQAS